MKPFIIKSNSGFFDVYDNGQVITCKARGRFRNDEITPLVGDEVIYSGNYLMEIITRKNRLIRPPIANIDQALIICSIKEPAISINLINQYLLSVIIKEIEPILVVSKMELATEKEINKLRTIYQNLGIKIYFISNITGVGISEIINLLPEKKSVFLGQSGVGKSSLINSIFPDFQKRVNTISKSLGRGRHTTRIVEFYEYNNGFIADTPGFSLLDMPELLPVHLKEVYPGFLKHFSKCKFRGCFHEKEPGCEIKRLVEVGTIDESIYQDYLKQLALAKERKTY